MAFAWPIVFFIDRIVPFGGTIRATANDFIYLYYAYKPYLLDCLVAGRLPLWSPSEAAGYPFYSNPFTQTFYPLNLPLALFYWWAGGYSSHDHQVFTAIGTALFSLGVYLWLRSLGSGWAAALFAAGAVSTSLRIGDMLRLPNAVHCAAWFPWALLAINGVVRASTPRRSALWALALSGILVTIVTAGYPYYLYYSLFLFVPYLVIVAVADVWPLHEGRASRAGRLGAVALAGALAALVCLPYLVKMKQLLDATAGRGGRPPGADDWYAFTRADSLASLLFPIGGTPEGGYYLGICGLLLVTLYLAELWRRRREVGGELRLAAALLVWVLLISELSYASHSPLFRTLAALVPGLDRLRAWGRINIVLLLVLAWLLARAFGHLESGLAAASHREPAAIGSRVLLASAFVIAVVQAALLLRGRTHPYYAVYEQSLLGWAAWCLPAGAAAGATILVLMRRAARGRPPRPAMLAAALLLVSAVDVWPISAPLWSLRRPRPQRVRFDVAGVLRRSLLVPRKVPGLRGDLSATYDTISMDYGRLLPVSPFSPAFNVSVVPEWYFERFARLLRERIPEEPQALATLMGIDDGRRLFATARVDHAAIGAFLADTAALAAPVEVRAYTGERLEADVLMPREGFLTFVDNWDPDWRATVDGRPVKLSLAFGTFKAVGVLRGRHRVVFEYVPRLWPRGPNESAGDPGPR